MQAPNNETL